MTLSVYVTNARRVEQLKDIAYDLGVRSLQGVWVDGPDSWTTITVSHAALMSEAEDGWDVEITRGEL